FFSSRRRHTTSKRDWSSDVCSSDLHLDEAGGIDVDTFSEVRERSARADLDLCAATVRDLHPADARRLLLLVFLALRTARLAATPTRASAAAECPLGRTTATAATTGKTSRWTAGPGTSGRSCGRSTTGRSPATTAGAGSGATAAAARV